MSPLNTMTPGDSDDANTRESKISTPRPSTAHWTTFDPTNWCLELLLQFEQSAVMSPMSALAVPPPTAAALSH